MAPAVSKRSKGTVALGLALAVALAADVKSAFVVPLPGVADTHAAPAHASASPRLASALRSVGGASYFSATAAACGVALALSTLAGKVKAAGKRARHVLRVGPPSNILPGPLPQLNPFRKEKYGPFEHQLPLEGGKRNFWPGTRGYSLSTPPMRDLPPPARHSLSKVEEPMATYVPSSYYSVPFAEMKLADVKKVGSCNIDKEGSITTPAANIADYSAPPKGLRMEREKGQKRPPEDTGLYKKYTDAHGRSLVGMAEKSAGSALGKDFITDRSCLTLLLDFVEESLTPMLRTRCAKDVPIDLVKISKEAGKGLVMERVFEKKNLWAERRPYRGGWKRSEATHNGTYSPAWHRLATGDHDPTCMMVTGIMQIPGVRAGVPDSHYQFCEYEIGGLSFLTRSRVSAKEGDKMIELRHKNWYYRQEITILRTYLELMLGGIDKMCLGLQRSGKLVRTVELTADDLLEKLPEVAETANRHLGRLVAMLKQVKEEVEKGGEGPFVLQWQDGELVLGKYQDPVEVEDDAVEELAEGEEVLVEA
eukprot:TRINITY_DN289_c0_g1_i1.p2 TRINITY_DN289_c0_g1~~TRINITY_DN289_c0_g1_i1.p2  ORF type:complete len:536 (+),score=182.44 TRINITY_DN289_c0_g1_i1:91-1698(+)